MKRPSVLTVFACVLLGFNGAHCEILEGNGDSVLSRVPRETGCPPPKQIEPCTCTQTPYSHLECMNILNAGTLRTVFRNSERYTYAQVNISFSSLLYLPHEMFDNTTVQKLILYNVTMAQLFDAPPRGADQLDAVHIENTFFQRTLAWNLFEPLTNLRILQIYFSRIRILGALFGQHVTKNLRQLAFYSTETRKINQNVLTEFVNLDRLAVDACPLNQLTRDLFPRPFNTRVLYFNENRITSIPADLFTEMPNLQTVSMRGNLISVLPQSAFGGSAARIEYVIFTGNPLKCDCLLQWIVKEKPPALRGRCAEPEHLQGRELSDLSPDEFNC